MFAAIPAGPITSISLLQPWGSFLAWWTWSLELERHESMGKAIETRSFYVDHRGPTAIHASKGEKDLVDFFRACERGDESPMVIHALAVIEKLYPGRNIEELFPLGQVLAIGNLVRVQRTETLRDRISPRELAFGNYGNKRWGWIFANVKMLETPIPARGALGLWQWDPHFVPVPREPKEKQPKAPKVAAGTVLKQAVPNVNQLRLFE